jgi:preprotein translocase subunit SecF
MLVMKRKIVTAVIVILVILVLFFLARELVSNFNFVEIVKKIHGG